MASGADFSDNSTSAMSRGNVYQVLSRLYIEEANRDVIEWLRSEGASAALESLGVDVAKILPRLDKGSENGADEGLDGFLDELSEEYAALFVLPGGVSPYESVRLTGQLCQDAEWDARKFYNITGLVLNDDKKIFSDHIGVELGFMGILAEKEHESWSSGNTEEALRWRELQHDFFTSHLNAWAADFLDDLEKTTRHGFYREAAVLTRRFLELEQDELAGDAGS